MTTAPAIFCNYNHFHVSSGDVCKTCGKLITRDKFGREIKRPRIVDNFTLSLGFYAPKIPNMLYYIDKGNTWLVLPLELGAPLF